MSKLRSNLSELDIMLQDLSLPAESMSYANSNKEDYTDYYSDLDYGDSLAPSRPPPPSDYELSPPGMIPSKKKRKNRAPSSIGSGKSTLSIPSKPPHPPKLEHALKDHHHDLVKAIKRNEEILKAPDEFRDESKKEGEETEEDYDYGTLASEEIHAGEAPRGDKSMIIHTDYGDLKSKYHYLGFGLWENTEPDEPPPPPRKLSPPPPPPKAEPIWYNCTVKVENHKTTKELDDLKNDLDGYAKFPNRNVEVGYEGSGIPGSLGELKEPFDKEDMSEMFRRAFLEKMASGEDETDKSFYNCFVCEEIIRGRIITAMTKKFHPECFVCSYCKQTFKDRRFKTDDQNTPYCYGCFEKLLGHFGNIRTVG